MRTLVKNGIIVNEGLSVLGSLLINGERIEKIIVRSSYNSDDEYLNAVGQIRVNHDLNAVRLE